MPRLHSAKLPAMKAAGEMLRWSIVVACVTAGIWILGTALQFLSSGASAWAKFLGLGAVAICLAAIPLVSALLAYERRWREFLALPIFMLTVFAWGLFLTIPGLIPLLDEALGLPNWRTLINSGAQGLLFFASFPFANWVYRQLLRILDRFMPPNPPVKEWIRRAC